jgi:hypothetical protein
LSLSIPTGTVSVGNSFVATAGQLTDLSGNGVHATQSTGYVAGVSTNKQPIVSKGLNGRAAVKTDAVSHYMIYTLDLPPPGTTPTFFFGAFRLLATAGYNIAFISDAVGTGMLPAIVFTGSSNLTQYNANSANVVAGGVNNWGQYEASYTNSIADYQKFGVNRTSGTSAGNNDAGSSRGLFGLPAGTNLGAWEFLMLITLNNTPTPTQLDAARAAVTSEYAGLVPV